MLHSMTRGLLRITALASVALTLAASSSAAPARPLTSFTVSATGGHFVGNDGALVLAFDLQADASAPQRLTIQVPKRFVLYPERTEGSPVGSARLELREGGFVNDYGAAIAVAGAGVAPACGVGNPLATWVIAATIAGGRLELPISLVSANGVLRLELCPPAQLNLASLFLALDDIFLPRTPGNYEWRAAVTPRSGPAYELRAAVPVPHVLTMGGRYDASRRTAVLTGTLRAHGHPRAGVTVVVTRLDRTAVPLAFHDTWIAATRTTAAGSYRVTIPLTRTRGFIAAALPTVRACASACRSTTVSGIESDPITVSVP